LLSCNHIYNQYIIIEDVQKTIKLVRSQNGCACNPSPPTPERMPSAAMPPMISLNEAIGFTASARESALQCHWCGRITGSDLKELKTQVSSALAQMDAVAKQETDGAPQIFWAGIPGNEADFPMNDTFDTFAEQAACFPQPRNFLPLFHQPGGYPDGRSSSPANRSMSIYPMSLSSAGLSLTGINLFWVLRVAENHSSPITWFVPITNKEHILSLSM
jgi:hypothetical protein